MTSNKLLPRTGVSWNDLKTNSFGHSPTQDGGQANPAYVNIAATFRFLRGKKCAAAVLEDEKSSRIFDCLDTGGNAMLAGPSDIQNVSNMTLLPASTLCYYTILRRPS